MAELSMNETTTFRWSFEEDVAQYAAAGIPAIGVWRQKLSDCGLSKARELLRRSGLKVSHLFWAGGFTGSDGRSYRESVDDAAEAVRTAAELDCRTLVVCSGPRAGHTYNHARRLVQGALTRVGPAGRRVGRHVGHRADARRLCRAVDIPHHARRYARIAGGGGQPAGQDGAGHVPSGPGERAGGAAGRDSAARWRLSSLATPGGRPRASRTAAGWAKAWCRWPRSSPP